MREKNKLSDQEFESIMLYLFTALAMSAIGFFLITMPDEAINEDAFYFLMDGILSVQIWGLLYFVGAAFILSYLFSMSLKRYYFLIVGGVIGVILGGTMTMLGFQVGENLYMPLQTGTVAFFDLVLVIYGGVSIWIEKRKIRM